MAMLRNGGRLAICALRLQSDLWLRRQQPEPPDLLFLTTNSFRLVLERSCNGRHDRDVDFCVFTCRVERFSGGGNDGHLEIQSL